MAALPFYFDAALETPGKSAGGRLPPARRVHAPVACNSRRSLRCALARMRSDGPAISKAATTAPSPAKIGAARALAPLTRSPR